MKKSTSLGDPTLSTTFKFYVCFRVIERNDIPNLQYNETNVTHFSFNLLRIKDFYMLRALLAHPQEALHKQFHCNRGTAN
jgi:hypothetical protein